MMHDPLSLRAVVVAVVAAENDRLALDTWGGDDAGVVATDSLTHVHVGCTYGDMRGPIHWVRTAGSRRRSWSRSGP